MLPAVPVQAASERALYLYYTHTKETARIVFKRNGQYVQSGLNELNQFLRDWRQNEPANMDPRLFDLVWEVYQEVGGTQPINVVSAYRSPKTNAMLAANSSGVADNSQHMRGTAMDFFIPGVPLARLRATAMKKQVGGVGYYPTSSSPFVHLDTGSVRAWPRMTRAQLQEVFPDGRTMHLPTDGKPLSQEGYQVAMAEWKRCHAYPCNGSSSGTQVASSGGSGRTLMDVLFGGNQSSGQSAPASAPAPQIQTASLAPQPTRQVAPVMPVLRPTDLGGDEVAVASVSNTAIPFSTTGSAPLTSDEIAVAAVTMPVSMPSDLRENSAVTALAALTAPTMPTPRVIMTDPPSDILTAYAAAPAADPGAQRALEMIIQNNTTASVTPAPLPSTELPPLRQLSTDTMRTASLGGGASTAPQGLFSDTFGATDAAKATPLAQALARHVAARPAPADMRKPALVAPDLEHVADIFTDPSSLTSDRYAVIFDRDLADFDPTPEMGRHVTVLGVGTDNSVPVHNRFTRSVQAPAQVN
ncbi:DUF882 domain-containing protein [Devosia lucknowensis]|uniref:DUF882 domain-containing protein n=1 Tax=Devosia lucknowensis TaxID=1096929 RepID=UPI003CC7F738